MNKIEEARTALQTTILQKDFSRVHAMRYADAYALAAHVDACEEFIYKASVAEYTSSQPISEKQRCGDDWYCDEAKEAWKEL